jgi:hypothetical protein
MVVMNANNEAAGGAKKTTPQTADEMIAALTASLAALGRKYLGPCYEHCTMADGSVRLVRIELWSVNGERSFGRILEVLS